MFCFVINVCLFDILSLLVEEIDVGESKVRQVVSGLAKYFSADDLVVCYLKLVFNYNQLIF